MTSGFKNISALKNYNQRNGTEVMAVHSHFWGCGFNSLLVFVFGVHIQLWGKKNKGTLHLK